METQWFEVKRPDGTLQYATKTDGGYLLYGSGFVIKKLDAISVTPINKVPHNFVLGRVGFDIPEMYYKGLIDLNNRWNGWYCPYISEDDIERLCEDVGDDLLKIKLLDNKTIQIIEEEEEDIIIAPTLFGDYPGAWYYFGMLGWCWDLEQ